MYIYIHGTLGPCFFFQGVWVGEHGAPTKSFSDGAAASAPGDPTWVKGFMRVAHELGWGLSLGSLTTRIRHAEFCVTRFLKCRRKFRTPVKISNLILRWPSKPRVCLVT